MSRARVRALIPKFMDEVLVKPVRKWGRQRVFKNDAERHTIWKDYRNENKPLKEIHVEDHFRQDIYDEGYCWWGSYGVALDFEETRLCCIDADTPEFLHKVVNNVLPVFKELEIDYIEEHSGTEEKPKGHFWFKVRTSNALLERLIRQTIEDAGLVRANGDFDEVYPLWDRRSSLIRLPCGTHLKNSDLDDKIALAHPITFNDETSNEPVFCLESFIEARTLSDEDVLSRLRSKPIERKAVFIPEKKDFFYVPRGLPLPDIELPPFIEVLAKNCQTINRVIEETIDNGMIEEAGGMHHTAGVYLSDLAQFNDYIYDTEDGRKWFQSIVETYRDRDPSSHNWDYYWGKDRNPNIMVRTCKTWSAAFDGYCKGCPFLNSCHSPRQFFYDKPIERRKIRDIKLVKFEDIRNGL
jgi:hypothetical protein